MPDADLIRLTPAHSKAAVETIVQAFYNDVLWRYLLPVDEALYNVAIRSIMGFPVRHGARYGEVYATSPAMEGVAVWRTPNTPKLGLIGSVRGGAFDIITVWFRLGRHTVRRLMETADRIQKAHARHAPGPHYYLEVIGVHPDHQGMGLGSRLMAPMLARADSERLPCYLETQTESNVAFYQKRGFEVVEVMDLPNGGPRGWLMLRPPPPPDQTRNA